MKHMNRFGKGKEQRPRIRVRILRAYGGMNAGAVISPPAGAAQILLAKKDQLGRHIAEAVDDSTPAVVSAVVTPTAEPEIEAAEDDAPAAAKKAASHGKSGSRK